MATPRENIEAALSTDGARDIPAVICYESIFIRDHWQALTSAPWWRFYSPDIGQQVAWRRDVLAACDYDWFELPSCAPRDERAALTIDVRDNGVYLVNHHTGAAQPLQQPRIGGWMAHDRVESIHPSRMPQNTEQVDECIPPAPEFDLQLASAEGRADVAHAMNSLQPARFPLGYVAAPLWQTYHLWGFEGMMEMIATRPQLVRNACERYEAWCLHAIHEAAFLGASGVWIEDCLTDMISERDFLSLNVPYVRRIVEEINWLGMKSIYYFCGNPSGKWDALLGVGADALALEESKKGFRIDIGEVVDRVAGRCAVLGNLDAIGVLQDGSDDELRSEIKRQIAAGRRNRSRFIMSIGSPVTPGTPVDRVRLYCDLVHGIGSL